MDGTTLIRSLAAALALASLSAAPTVGASGARQGVKAQPGEIVLLRDVAARPAYRMAPPGMALIADPKPQREIATSLGTGAAGSGMMNSARKTTPAWAPAAAPGLQRHTAPPSSG